MAKARDGDMRLIPITTAVACVLAGLFSLGTAGCINQRSNGPTAMGRNDQQARSGIAQGQPQAGAQSRSLFQRLRKEPTSVALDEPIALSSDKRSQVYLALGQMLESVGKLADAQQQYEQAVKADPSSLKAKLALARVYTLLGRPDAAVKTYEQAEKKHRNSPTVYNDKGMLLAEQKEWTKAIATLRQAVKLDPSNTKYHNNLGMVLAACGKYDEAWGEFREAVGAGPAHYNVAYMLVRSGRTAEARTRLVQALDALPNLNEAAALLAQINNSQPHAVSQIAPTVRKVEAEATLIPASLEELPNPANTELVRPNTQTSAPVVQAAPVADPNDDGTELVPVIYEEETPATTR